MAQGRQPQAVLTGGSRKDGEVVEAERNDAEEAPGVCCPREGKQEEEEGDFNRIRESEMGHLEESVK